MTDSPNIQREKQRATRLLSALKKMHPRAGMMLRYSNNWELLVAVMLSAQCTDKKVNEVTAKLFKKYKKLSDYVSASPKEFEKDIFQTGFYRAKTRHILKTARIIQEKYGGKIPKTMEELIELPGVARKTANVVLGNAYGIVEGVAVDTHVMRLSKRFGLTKAKDPKHIEKDLMKLFPKKEWFDLTYFLIEYGRNHCPARGCPKDHPLSSFDIKG